MSGIGDELCVASAGIQHNGVSCTEDSLIRFDGCNAVIDVDDGFPIELRERSNQCQGRSTRANVVVGAPYRALSIESRITDG